ncbi:MAG: HAD hydrolase-like protein [Bacteroidetes bacterium]|jgi:phosphoglycolate phosphatase|nr:HAD hydrolase-like protein [Bacteroidota bacterium]
MPSVKSLNQIAIIWDWNGTLLDDVDICVEAMNRLLLARELPQISAAHYREVFRFPVKDYYFDLGFDFVKEPFEVPAMEFIQHYRDLLPNARLFPAVRQTLESFQQAGIRQFVLSAMEQQLLHQLLQEHELVHFFEHIQGIEDHFANGKLAAAQKLVQLFDVISISGIMIGDTLHDASVSEAIGIKAILFSGGHFSDKRLQNSTFPVMQNFSEIRQFIENAIR